MFWMYAFLFVISISFTVDPAFSQPSESEAADPRVDGAVEENFEDLDALLEEKYAGERGYREGKMAEMTVEIYLDGKQIGMVTPEEFRELGQTTIFTPRGPKKGWPAMAVIEKKGVHSGKSIRFVNVWGKSLDLLWEDLSRQRDTVVMGYNFKGHLVLETDVGNIVPRDVQKMDENQVREQMHKGRQQSLIFLRNVSRIEIQSN